ncbi:hypothetical protein N0V95_004675 [Ascochyta clinopodiicola]|nr:hypothetical protein N0V95_004675 [Ascochyta clinopodiicola]
MCDYINFDMSFRAWPMGTFSFTQNLNDWHMRVLRILPDIVTDFSSAWREAHYSGRQPEVVNNDLPQAVDLLHTSALTNCERGALWNQVFEVAYLRPLNALETVAWDRALTDFADYLDLDVRPLPNWYLPEPFLPTPPVSQHVSLEEDILSRADFTSKSPDPLPGALSLADPLPPKKRARKSKSPDAPPKEKKPVGRPPGSLDKEARLPRNTMKGMSAAEKRSLARERAAQRLQQPTPPSEET